MARKVVKKVNPIFELDEGYRKKRGHLGRSDKYIVGFANAVLEVMHNE